MAPFEDFRKNRERKPDGSVKETEVAWEIHGARTRVLRKVSSEWEKLPYSQQGWVGTLCHSWIPRSLASDSANSLRVAGHLE